MEKIAYVYAPISMNPACPRENRPVKPLRRFMETATNAYTDPFSSTVKSILIPDVGGTSISPI